MYMYIWFVCECTLALACSRRSEFVVKMAWFVDGGNSQRRCTKARECSLRARPVQRQL